MKTKIPTVTLTREEVGTVYYALLNYRVMLRAEIKTPTRPHGPAESAMTLCDAEPLLERLEAWLKENPR